MSSDMTFRQACRLIGFIVRTIVRSKKLPAVSRRDSEAPWMWSEAAIDARRRGDGVAFLGPGSPADGGYARPGDIWISDPRRPIKTHHTVSAGDDSDGVS